MGGPRSRYAQLVVAILVVLAARGVMGQELIERDVDLADRPVATIELVGAAPADEQLLRNNIRTVVGDPYDAATVRADVARVHNLGRYRGISAEVMKLPDGSVAVRFSVTEQPLIREVQTVGNKAINDQDLLEVVQLVRGLVRDDYLIEKAKRDIEAEYRRRGYYLTDVTIDESQLEEHGLLILRVIEGPRVRIKAIEFKGVTAFEPQSDVVDGELVYTPKQLRGEIKTRTHLFIIRAGILDEDVLAADVAAIDTFYKDRGYLDVRVDRTIELSPDNREAKVTFLISEGRQYIVRSIRAERATAPGESLTVFDEEQIAAIIEIKPGDVYSEDKVRKSIALIDDAYGVLGYVTESQGRLPRADVIPLRVGPEPEVDLLLIVDEGAYATQGVVQILGNFLTKDKVIRRLLRLEPGRPYDTRKVRESQRRIEESRLFSRVRLTIQQPDPYVEFVRDMLVEVQERNTGAVTFGVAVGSDQGVFGDISISQDNFDIADTPESLEEFVRGRAFRGAGQRFSMIFRPGNEIFQYIVNFSEPHLLETDYGLNLQGSFTSRIFSDYDEDRLTGRLGLTRQFGEIWQVGVRSRAERVELSNIDFDAPVDVFRDAGPDTITSLGVVLSRTTIGTYRRPGRGSRFEVSFDRVGVMGGDFDYFNVSADYTAYFTLAEDFLGRKSILKLDGRVGYIFDGRAPTYERFYLGGRTFRGFDFREVSPKGIRADNGRLGDDPIGGNWQIFFGAQYDIPILEETITGVLFVDTGTVTSDIGFDDYRVSVGAGIRLHVPQLGPVPIAFDFGFPIIKEPTDETRVLTFSVELPF